MLLHDRPSHFEGWARAGAYVAVELGLTELQEAGMQHAPARRGAVSKLVVGILLVQLGPASAASEIVKGHTN